MGTNQEEKKALAKKAKDKPASHGTDIDMEAFSSETEEHPYREDLSAFSKIDQEQMLKAGVDIAAKNRSGTFVQKDHSVGPGPGKIRLAPGLLGESRTR